MGGFSSLPVYGRLIGEIACTLMTLAAVGRAHVLLCCWRRGQGSTPVLPGIENGMMALRGDLEGIIAFCKRKVV